jgi:hypothetical protein
MLTGIGSKRWGLAVFAAIAIALPLTMTMSRRQPPPAPVPAPTPVLEPLPLPLAWFADRWRDAELGFAELALQPRAITTEIFRRAQPAPARVVERERERKPEPVKAAPVKVAAPAKAATAKATVKDVCAAHGMKKVVTNNGKSWRCRKK